MMEVVSLAFTSNWNEKGTHGFARLQEEPNVNTLTALFFTLVFFAATQGKHE